MPALVVKNYFNFVMISYALMIPKMMITPAASEEYVVQMSDISCPMVSAKSLKKSVINFMLVVSM